MNLRLTNYLVSICRGLNQTVADHFSTSQVWGTSCLSQQLKCLLWSLNTDRAVWRETSAFTTPWWVNAANMSHKVLRYTVIYLKRWLNYFGWVAYVGSTQHQNAGYVCSPGATCAILRIHNEGLCKGMWKMTVTL